jgi:hypothetical protein
MRDPRKLALAVLAVTALVGSALASRADKLFPGRVEGKAEIWLSSKTRFSGFTLPPGRYVLEHRVDGGEHAMDFIQVRPGNNLRSAPTHRVMPVRVKCTLEPLPGKATRTAFYAVAEGDASRAVRLEIKGEKVAHVFPMPPAPQPMQSSIAAQAVNEF